MDLIFILTINEHILVYNTKNKNKISRLCINEAEKEYKIIFSFLMGLRNEPFVTRNNNYEKMENNQKPQKEYNKKTKIMTSNVRKGLNWLLELIRK